MCRARWYLFRPFDSLTRDLSEFIRTDVLLACVRECVKNVHATHTLTQSQTPPTQTVWVPRISSVYPLCVFAPRFTCSTQSINPEIVFTLHIITSSGESLRGFFFFLPSLGNANPPHSSVVDSSTSGTHTALTLLLEGYPTRFDLLPRIHRVSAVSGDDDSSRVLSSSVVRFPTMLLTHWTKIDSTAAAAATFQLDFLFQLFIPLYSTTLFINSPFPSHFFIRESFLSHFKPPSIRPSWYTTLLLALDVCTLLLLLFLLLHLGNDDSDGHLVLKWPKYNPAGTTSSCCTTTSRSIPVSSADVP